MIDPKLQWANQVEVTNACGYNCSNCTRLLGHVEKPFFIEPAQFRKCCQALADFPAESPTSEAACIKVVGMIGGEPMIHPQFAELVRIMVETIPHGRGLWTRLPWQKTKHAALIQKSFTYVNNNLHQGECRHSPILVAIEDVVTDPVERWKLIDNCWLQRLWSASITPKGYFFCEVAGAMDLVFDGPGGLPVEPGCWRRPIADFRAQIERWCPRCGIPLNLKGRIDKEDVDDISPSNLALLARSPRVKAKRFVLYDPAQHQTDDAPWRYLK